MNPPIIIPIIAVVVIFAAGIRIVPPTRRGVIERLSKYHRSLNVGFNWVIPIIETTRYRNITERMTNIASQEIITKDNLSAKVELVVYRACPQSGLFLDSDRAARL